MTSGRTVKLGDLAQAVGGTLHGNPELAISRIRPLEDAAPGDLSFFAPSTKKQQQALRALAERSTATALLVAQKLETISTAQIVVKSPMASVIRLAIAFSIAHPFLRREFTRPPS